MFEILLFFFILALFLNEKTRFLAIVLVVLFIGSFFQFIANNMLSVVILAATFVAYSYFKKNSG